MSFIGPSDTGPRADSITLINDLLFLHGQCSTRRVPKTKSYGRLDPGASGLRPFDSFEGKAFQAPGSPRPNQDGEKNESVLEVNARLS
jgi:hypothetical protein